MYSLESSDHEQKGCCFHINKTFRILRTCKTETNVFYIFKGTRAREARSARNIVSREAEIDLRAITSMINLYIVSSYESSQSCNLLFTCQDIFIRFIFYRVTLFLRAPRERIVRSARCPLDLCTSHEQPCIGASNARISAKSGLIGLMSHAFSRAHLARHVRLPMLANILG